nr:anaerobic C4-dicarboxylate transporter family protein [Photobacterium kishitanii]
MSRRSGIRSRRPLGMAVIASPFAIVVSSITAVDVADLVRWRCHHGSVPSAPSVTC